MWRYWRGTCCIADVGVGEERGIRTGQFAHLGEQLSPQKRILLRRSQSKAPQGALQDRNRMGKTHPIRVLIAETGPQVHQDAQGKVGQQHGIQLLLHALWRLATQCARREAQMRSKFINATFDLESRS
jgi:hypothetical protein